MLILSPTEHRGAEQGRSSQKKASSDGRTVITLVRDKIVTHHQLSHNTFPNLILICGYAFAGTKKVVRFRSLKTSYLLQSFEDFVN
jgi:hypothetical protein